MPNRERQGGYDNLMLTKDELLYQFEVFLFLLYMKIKPSINSVIHHEISERPTETESGVS